MTEPHRLVDLLDLETIEADIFRGRSPDTHRQRTFGGEVAGQALVAAGRTVPAERPVHSLHAYFLRPGDPSIPIVYEVDRIRDGRSFTTRRVVAVQHGKPIFNLAASFHLVESGLEHMSVLPDVPAPESLPTLAERLAPYRGQLGDFWEQPNSIELRYVDDPPWVARTSGGGSTRQRVWLRTDRRLPDDPLLHVCALAYASDITLLDAVLARHGVAWALDDIRGASLDHAMWFHRPFRADEWLLYDQESPSASGARGLAQGRIFTADGQHVVTVVQEGLLRVVSRGAPA